MRTCRLDDIRPEKAARSHEMGTNEAAGMEGDAMSFFVDKLGPPAGAPPQAAVKPAAASQAGRPAPQPAQSKAAPAPVPEDKKKKKGWF
jgi:hypothetical protein